MGQFKMVLDVELFRADKGGDPKKVRENQAKRFKDVTLVDRVVESDTKWRKLRFQADEFNKLKNQCSKAIGKKMKDKEPVGEDDTLPEDVANDPQSFTLEKMETFTVVQLRKLSQLMDEGMKRCNEERIKSEAER